MDMKDYEGNPIIEKLECEYLKNNIKIKDEIYIILIKNLKNNLININAETVYIFNHFIIKKYWDSV